MCFNSKVSEIFTSKIRKKQINEFTYRKNTSWYTSFLNTKIIISTERTLSAAWLLVVFGCGLGGWGDGWWLDDDECCGDSGDDLSVDRLLLDCCKMLEESLSSSSREVYCNPDFTFVGLCGSERLVFTSSSLTKFRVWL